MKMEKAKSESFSLMAPQPSIVGQKQRLPFDSVHQISVYTYFQGVLIVVEDQSQSH
jgi:hypothetical protein